MGICSLRVAAVVLLSAAFLIRCAAVDSVHNEEWSPIKTVSEPVSFSPEFYGQHSEENVPDVLRHASSIRFDSRTRNSKERANSGGSPFVATPKIASVSVDEVQ
jgi:hypothetical protein